MDLDDLLDDIDIPEDEEVSGAADMKSNLHKRKEEAELDEVDMDSELKTHMEEQVSSFHPFCCYIVLNVSTHL